MSSSIEDRRGLTRRPGGIGSVLFILGIGAVVAGAGIAGLRYRNQMWDETAHTEQAAPTEPWQPPTVHLTSAEDLPHASTVITTKDEDDGKDAGAAVAPAPVKAATPPARAHRSPRPKPKDDALPAERGSTGSEGDVFAKPE